MTQELIRKRTSVFEEECEPAHNVSWHLAALIAVLSLSAFLNLFHLSDEGFAISYYAAAVKNMLASWHNFFFVSFDSGFVSVDKPPLGLWIQAASAYLFGFNGLSLLLPQAIAGVMCVALIYYLVRRSFGALAGLIAALVLALTPISVATSRNNTMDMLLVLSVLVAAWAFLEATQSRRGSLGWLMLGAVVVGLGFNIKMLEAFLVLPALYMLYVVGAPERRLERRLVNLGLATVVVVAVSLSWAVVVDLTPADQRPYVGSTTDNSVTDLIVGYNGLDRLLGTSFKDEEARAAGELGGPGLGAKQNGEPGPLRLLNHQYAGQIGWLLPLAVVGLLVAIRQSPQKQSPQKQSPLRQSPLLRLVLGARHQGLVLWGVWFLTAAAYFSVAGGQHRYYTVMLAPAAAALVGAGVVALWNDYQSTERGGWLLPLVLMGMAALQAYILGGYEIWNVRLIPVIVGLCFIAAVILVVLPRESKPKIGATAATATAVGVLALLIAPAIWASYQVFEGPRESTPLAGPPSSQKTQAEIMATDALGGQGLFEVGTLGEASLSDSVADPALINYLQANQGDVRYLVAGTRSKDTAAVMLSTDKPVISLGGYSGLDPVFTKQRLTDLVNEGAVRFFLIPNTQHMNCKRVPQELWQSPTLGQGGVSMNDQTLYDCGAGRR